MTTAATLRAEALAAAARGDDAAADKVFAQAIRSFPVDAVLLNSAGNFHAAAGRSADALALFDRALAADPASAEAAINRAIVLTRLHRATEAAADLAAREAELADTPRYWTTRAAAENAGGAVRAAAASYDEQLRRDPRNRRALHGRARTALDGGDAGAVELYDRALAEAPGDPWLLHGLAQALDASGDRAAALDLAARLAAQLPQWIDALELYATLRWAAGDRGGFCDHYGAAIAHHADGAAERSWATMLAGVDRHAAAAAVLTHARNRMGERDELMLAEATYLGEAGDDALAASVFDRSSSDAPDWQIET